MAAVVEKRVSEWVLDSLTRDLKPDIPMHNKLRRSWLELEKHKYTQNRQLQHRKRDIATRTQLSMQETSKQSTTSENELFQQQDLPVPAENLPSASTVPGFRYKANGEIRQSLEQSRKDTLVKSLTGLSRHVTEKKQHQSSSSKPVAISCQPSTDSVLTLPDTTPGAGEDPESSVKKQNVTESAVKKHHKSFGFQDENSALRVRKVQEQLGLSSGPQNLDTDRNANMHLPGHHALKTVHIFRSAEVEAEKDKSTNNPAGQRKKTVKDANTCQSQNNMEGTTTVFGSVTSLRADRCGACRYVPRTEIKDLVRCSNPALHIKPRWKHAPVGRYVPPPPSALCSSNSSLYHWSRSDITKKDSSKLGRVLSAKTSRYPDAGAPSCSLKDTSDSSDSSTPFSMSRLQAMRRLSTIWHQLGKSGYKSEDRMSVDFVVPTSHSTNQSGYNGAQASGDRQLGHTSSTLCALRKKNEHQLNRH